jgi:hypothetical protein
MSLPFIEQGNLAATYNGNVSTGGGAANLALNAADVATYRCPSAPQLPPSPFPGLPTLLMALGNYVCNNGLGPMTSVQPPTIEIARTVRQGVFAANRKLGIRDMTDGTSNTTMVSETLANASTATVSDWRGNLTYPENCMFHWNEPPNSRTPDRLRTALCVSTPQIPCVGVFTAFNRRDIIATARSFHTGGVQAVFGDGSVRFVSQNISLLTWQAVGSPNGGEVVNEEI